MHGTDPELVDMQNAVGALLTHAQGVVTVQELGATGVGGDDTAVIKAALVAGAGRVVRFTPGTYKISAVLSPAADTTIEGVGAVTINPATGYSGIAFQVRANRVTLSGLTFGAFTQSFDANNVSDFTARNCRSLSSALTGLGEVTTCSRVRITDNYVDSAAGISIALHGNTDVIVARNIITNGGDDGIAVRALTGQGADTVICDNIIDDCGKAGIKLTVESSSTAGSQNQYATITGNVIRKWGKNAGEAAITIDNNLSAGELNQVICVANNSMQSANRTNEYSYISVTHVKDAAITGNVMRGGVNFSGIIVQNSSYVTVTGNVVADACQVSALTNIGGIQVLVSNDCTVIGNTIRNTGLNGSNTPPGIYAEQSQYNTVIGNVTIDDRGASAAMSYGINMASAGATKCDFNTVVGNTSKGFLTAPLVFGLQQSQQALVNIGDWYQTHATLTFLSGAATRVIAHSLGVVPTRVQLTPTSSLTAATKFWWAGATAFNITITMDADPTVNVTFNAELGAGYE